MDPQTAKNGLTLLTRVTPYLVLTGQEAIAWTRFVDELVKIAANENDDGSDQETSA